MHVIFTPFALSTLQHLSDDLYAVIHLIYNKVGGGYVILIQLYRLEADQWFRLREAGDVTHPGLQVVHSHLQPWIYIAHQNQRMIEHRAL